jgi:hypothetical protein
VHDAAIAGCAHQCAKILTLIPSQINFSEENRNSALYVCQMIIEPLKDIFPKAKILVSTKPLLCLYFANQCAV